MKTCPRCGKTFNFWQRAVGEAREHIRHCRCGDKKTDLTALAAHCRGCPAGCFEKIANPEEK